MHHCRCRYRCYCRRHYVSHHCGIVVVLFAAATVINNVHFFTSIYEQNPRHDVKPNLPPNPFKNNHNPHTTHSIQNHILLVNIKY